MSKIKPSPTRALRKKTGLSQARFWNKVGMTQSAGSRYESGRRVPKPVDILLVIAHGTDKQAKEMFDRLRTLEAA